MQSREATIRRRELGEALRRAMEQAELTGQEMARLLDWSPSGVSRLLSGKGGASLARVSAFLAICQVTGAERDRLLELCEEQSTPGWLQQHGSRLPRQLMTLIDHENKAVTIDDFQAIVVPGLLQTGDYAHAVISRIATVPGTEVNDRVAARLARQSMLSREQPARFTFYLHEFVLRLPVGDSMVMSEQLHHLLRMSVRPYLTLRVVPAAFGAHAGSAGSFTFMEFTEFKPMVYLESEASCLFLEKPQEIAAYQHVLGALAEAALDEEESRKLIASLATEFDVDREAYDDGP
jgi:transcriptional regulator with XRE-family HTH domain